MSSSNTVAQGLKSVASALPRRNPSVRKKLYPLPLRSIQPDRFVPPRGKKQIFLPNFTLAFIRPHSAQPPNYATFLTPLWMNKFDLKDYLYNLYNVEAIHIRSYIIHGKVRRERRTGVLFRRPQKKKMTIEMKPGDNFVWPDAPEDLEPWNQKLQKAQEEEKKEAMKGRSEGGTNLQTVPRDERKSIREQARALLEGRQKWKPGWQLHGTETEPLGARGGASALV